MKINPDTEVAVMAEIQELRSMPFQTKILPEAASIAAAIQTGRNVYLMPSSGWVVKVFLYGRQRCLRFFPVAEFDNACRLADMAIQLFAGLRIRTARSPLEYNLSEEQRKADLYNELDIACCLRRIESLIPDPPERESRQGAGRNTASQRFDKMLARLDALEIKLDLVLTHLKSGCVASDPCAKVQPT